MERLRRSERTALIAKILSENPGKHFSLGYFAELFGAAKSSISEDLANLRNCFRHYGEGNIETFPGASGGVVYYPFLSPGAVQELASELCAELSDPDRIIAGGFLYTSDVIFSPGWSWRVGHFFASHFRPLKPSHVVTVEAKGIPLALMTARALNLPLVTVRRDSRVTEGSAVSINYVSGTTNRIQTMVLPRRALAPGSRALLIDDFMKGGGTARGVRDLLREFGSTLVGTGVLVETAQPVEKRVSDYLSLLVLEKVDPDERKISLRPSPKLEVKGGA